MIVIYILIAFFYDIKHILSHSEKAVVIKRRNNILYCKLIQNEIPPAGLTFALLYHLILTVEKWFKWVNWWTVLRDFRHGLGSSQAPKLPQFFVPWRQCTKMRFEQRTLVLSLVCFIYSFLGYQLSILVCSSFINSML